jgi:hypothetical protein
MSGGCSAVENVRRICPSARRESSAGRRVFRGTEMQTRDTYLRKSGWNQTLNPPPEEVRGCWVLVVASLVWPCWF